MLDTVSAGVRMGQALVCDLDGTLLDWREGHVEAYDERSVREGVEANARACSRVRRFRARGWSVWYLTARSEELREVTEQQLVAARLPTGPLIMQSEFTSLEAIAPFKAAHLRRIADRSRRVLFVGDRVWDEEAAVAAGVEYMDVADWRALAGCDGPVKGDGASEQLEAGLAAFFAALQAVAAVERRAPSTMEAYRVYTSREVPGGFAHVSLRRCLDFGRELERRGLVRRRTVSRGRHGRVVQFDVLPAAVAAEDVAAVQVVPSHG